MTTPYLATATLGLSPSSSTASQQHLSNIFCGLRRRCLETRVQSLPVYFGCREFMEELNSGHAIVALSAVFLAIGSYAVFFSAFLPLTGVPVSPVHLHGTRFSSQSLSSVNLN